MADSNLTINLTLNDQASAQLAASFKKLADGAKDVADKHDGLNKKSDDANKNFLRLTVTIAGVIKAYRMMSEGITEVITVGRQMDSDFNKSFNAFEISILKVQQSIAQRLIPVLKTALDFWSEFLNKNVKDDRFAGWNQDIEKTKQLIGDLNILLSFTNGEKARTNIEAVIAREEQKLAAMQNIIEGEKQRARGIFETNLLVAEGAQLLKDYAREAQNIDILFISGKQSAIDYYNALLEKQSSIIVLNKNISDDLKQLASLQVELSNSAIAQSRANLQEQISLLQFYKQEFILAHQGMAAFTVTVGKAIQTNLSNALTGIITGAKTAKEAFADLGRAMVEAVVNFMVQKVVAWVLEKTLLAGTVAASTAAGAAIAAAWAPAAAMVSLATLGANAAPAAAALASTTALAISLGSFSGGAGQAGAAGAGSAVAEPQGAIDLGKLAIKPRAMGGDDFVSRPTLFLAGENGPERVQVSPMGSRDFSGTGGGDINIYISAGNIGSQDDVRRLTEEIGYELQRTGRFARGI